MARFNAVGLVFVVLCVAMRLLAAMLFHVVSYSFVLLKCLVDYV